MTIKGESAQADGRSVSVTEGHGPGPGRDALVAAAAHPSAPQTGLPAWENMKGRRREGAGSLMLHYVIAKHCSPKQEMKKTPLCR